MNVWEATKLAVNLLWPLIEGTAEYLAGKRSQLPELPKTLAARVELEKAKSRARGKA